MLLLVIYGHQTFISQKVIVHLFGNRPCFKLEVVGSIMAHMIKKCILRSSSLGTFITKNIL